MRPLERLRRLGIVGPNLISVHSVHLTAGEIELLADHASSVAHCPSSNLKLASGFAPVAALVSKGVNVGLGTDGAASNNRLDAFQEMRQAALLAKAVAGNAEAIPAHTALRMATLAGARAMGLDKRIGSILPGKRADLAAVRFAGPGHMPVFDPVSHLVYCAGREDVSDVWVDGHRKMAGRVLKDMDIPALDTCAKLWQNILKN
jgi:5-methylthioadenosine/S-adenosylhomocysteine deaminase